MLDKARVAIASKGVPQSGRFGFELFDKPNWIGSEFDEKVNYQRALEGELEHTIETLDAVRSARVHIVLPKQGAFLSEDVPAKASVVVKLRRSDLPREQASSIRGLLAGAVEGLRADAVTLVDADGRSDLNAPTAHAQEADQELALQQKLISMLEPLAGPGNVRATVDISYREGTEDRTDEIYDPAQTVAVSTQRSEQNAQSTRNGGIAGAASNTPAAVPAATPPLLQTGAAAAPATTGPSSTAASSANGQVQTSREESSSYAVTRHLVHTLEGPGRIRRVSTAVLVNDRMGTEGSGKREHTVWKPRSADEMRRLQQLAEAAVGYETSRGDQLVLQNVSFTGNVETAATPVLERLANGSRDLLRSQPSLLRTIAMGVALLAVGLMVLRPLVKQTSALLTLPAHSASSALASGTETTLEAALPELPAKAAPTQAQAVFDRVREQIRKEPQSSARLLESWLAAPVDEVDA